MTKGSKWVKRSYTERKVKKKFMSNFVKENDSVLKT